MKYDILISKKSRKFIVSQPKNQQIRIINAINKLPDVGDIKFMSGKDDTFRLRVGDYRIIYRKQDKILLITVIDIGNRGQVYKNLNN